MRRVLALFNGGLIFPRVNEKTVIDAGDPKAKKQQNQQVLLVAMILGIRGHNRRRIIAIGFWSRTRFGNFLRHVDHCPRLGPPSQYSQAPSSRPQSHSSSPPSPLRSAGHRSSADFSPIPPLYLPVL